MRILSILLVLLVSSCSATKKSDTGQITITGTRVAKASVDPVGSMNGKVVMSYFHVLQKIPEMSFILNDIGAPEPKRGDTKPQVLSQVEASEVQVISEAEDSIIITSRSKTQQLTLQVIFTFENDMFKMYEISTGS